MRNAERGMRNAERGNNLDVECGTGRVEFGWYEQRFIHSVYDLDIDGLIAFLSELR